MSGSNGNTPTFSAFISSANERRECPTDSDLAEERNMGAERQDVGSQPSEITVLERRVLAHERILQALIEHLAGDNSEIMVRLKARFGQSHNLGEHEQDFVSTDHLGDRFIRSIEERIDIAK
ncbi:hypothetical protein [Novosphingobium sp. KACC 22771]|jgi:hypothetical protein|uniref:hypothetical protein n=1 Tax=Novosphingobium sp. KACC 22771 TaxID=3025670 RepID=UPI00236505E9|nr:hypothetical protein [Novosphingobium sp. KACC 22771]WDF72504.1 hypothetical protein PQ467_00225 [Novosphingobium sp. KACC 22771]